MEVLNDLLNYNNLKIFQNTDWFSFSIDSVLLANFVKVNPNSKIIDFCTGNAPIPLFLSTKTSTNLIGVELQEEICELALKSIKINNLEKQIQIINSNVKHLPKLFETDTFDLITCNPPYFKYNKSNSINDNKIKAVARHEIELSLNDIFKVSKKILKNNGRIALVHRTDRLMDIIVAMKENNIEPKRIKFIYPFLDSNSNLVLVEGSKNGKPGLVVEKNLIIHNSDGTYSKEIIEIFNGGKNEN